MKVNLEQALNLLNNNDICAVPTETVYGLAARFDNNQAIKKIFAAKQRPLNHPLIVHIGSKTWLDKLANDLPDYVQPLIDAFWPGPLTLVLKKQNLVSDLITAGQSTVAIRMPRQQQFLELLTHLDCPVVAPSANQFCQTSPTVASHVEQGLGESMPVIDGGPCKVGIESTIVLATNPTKLTILRPGIISSDMLSDNAQVPCEQVSQPSVKVAGSHKIHYRPQTPLYVSEQPLGTEELNDDSLYMLLNGKASNNTIIMPNDPIEYASMLYASWHSEQAKTADTIIIELPPNESQWQGIRDRILKASRGNYNKT